VQLHACGVQVQIQVQPTTSTSTSTALIKSQFTQGFLHRAWAGCGVVVWCGVMLFGAAWCDVVL
jgi:hypothetical protein